MTVEPVPTAPTDCKIAVDNALFVPASLEEREFVEVVVKTTADESKNLPGVGEGEADAELDADGLEVIEIVELALTPEGKRLELALPVLLEVLDTVAVIVTDAEVEADAELLPVILLVGVWLGVGEVLAPVDILAVGLAVDEPVIDEVAEKLEETLALVSDRVRLDEICTLEMTIGGVETPYNNEFKF